MTKLPRVSTTSSNNRFNQLTVSNTQMDKLLLKLPKIKDYEIWWNKLVKTTVKINHIRPDIILWNNKEKTFTMIEICVPLDTNATKRNTDKEDICYQLVNQLRTLYPCRIQIFHSSHCNWDTGKNTPSA